MSIERQPLGHVYTASQGTQREAVDASWRADDADHVWFVRPGPRLRTGDHLFALAARRRSAVLGLWEVLGDGTFELPNPWEPGRWNHATPVRALATVPVIDATPVDGLVGPRGFAEQMKKQAVINMLYAHVDNYELDTEDTHWPRPLRPKPDRQPRQFDPTHTPSPASSSAEPSNPVARADLSEQRNKAHHQILVRLQAWLLEQGWGDIVEIPGAIDLAATRADGQRIIFEAKTITAGSELHQTRSALAQLQEYRIQHGQPSDALCLITDRVVSAERAVLLDQLQIAVAAQPRAAPEPLTPAAAALLELDC